MLLLVQLVTTTLRIVTDELFLVKANCKESKISTTNECIAPAPVGRESRLYLAAPNLGSKLIHYMTTAAAPVPNTS